MKGWRIVGILTALYSRSILVSGLGVKGIVSRSSTKKKGCCHFQRLTLIAQDLGRKQIIHSDKMIGESMVEDGLH